MSEGNTKPPTNPVVAEAHEVDTYRKLKSYVLSVADVIQRADCPQTRQRKCLPVSLVPNCAPSDRVTLAIANITIEHPSKPHLSGRLSPAK
jgi:hypothetical protein